jgi:hypothetical protein
MCKENKFIYGFFGVDNSGIVDLGFWCTDDEIVQILYCETCYKYGYSTEVFSNIKPLKQWYDISDRITAFQAHFDRGGYISRWGVQLEKYVRKIINIFITGFIVL